MCEGCHKRKQDVKWPKETDYRPYCSRDAKAYLAGRHNGYGTARRDFRGIINVEQRDEYWQDSSDATIGERRAYKQGHEAGERLFRKTLRDWLDVYSKHDVEQAIMLKVR